jgi:N-acetylglutamate synthase
VTTFTSTDVCAMERAAARAWPAGRIETVAGWDVRLSGGGTRRTNSVLPLDYTGAPLDAAIQQVEALYRGQKTRCYFQVSSASSPHDLDAQLASRGYVYEEPCLLLAKPLAPLEMPEEIEVTSAPTADWLSVFAEPLDDARRAAAPNVLARVPEPRAFLLVRRDGQPLAVALAVVAPNGIALVECVATQTAARRSGGAQRVMAALEAWSAAQGAKIAALQVTVENTAARALYAQRRYTEAGRYHYRWKDVV